MHTPDTQHPPFDDELDGVVTRIDVGEPPPRGLAFVLKRRMLRVG